MQQNSDVKLWGWGPGSLKVAIVCSWSPKDTIFAPIDGTCTWQATIKTPAAPAPSSIEFWCNNKLTKVEDILLGEVWLCSGQSNMELPTRVGITDAPDVYKNCSNNGIRFFEVKKDFDKFPKSNCEGEWKICDSVSLSSFSAVAYFFGNRLNSAMNVPVGLIGSYWGGTNIGSWCSSDIIAKDPELQKNKRDAVTYAPQSNSGLYNGMIVPLAPYKLAGAIWYQGESNVWTDPETYSVSLANMIQNWRTLFESDLSFYIVQIAPWTGYKPGILSAFLREQQEIAGMQHKTGMVTIGDLVVKDVTDIHPRAKAGVGLRLANLALSEVYGKNEIMPYSPGFESVVFTKNTASVIVKSLQKLKCPDKEIKSFTIAGSDMKFFDATAKLSKDGSILVSSKEVPNPVAVRYCFTGDAIPNLFDVNGLPLRPFRTDQWGLGSK
jgi:sialate O-acetylesterase